MHPSYGCGLVGMHTVPPMQMAPSWQVTAPNPLPPAQTVARVRSSPRVQHAVPLRYAQADPAQRFGADPAKMVSAQTLVNQGLTFKDTDPKRSIQLMKDAIAICPFFEFAYFNLAVVYTEQQQTDKALACYRRVLQITPNNAQAYNNMGVIYKTGNKLVEAIECFEAAVHHDPNMTMGLNNVAVNLIMFGKFQAALKHLKRATEVDPNNADTYNNLGLLYWDQGDVMEAVKMYDKACALRPHSGKSHQNRLLALNYLDLPLDDLFAAHSCWAQHYLRNQMQDEPFTEWPLLKKATGQRLRVGYIGADFYHHSVSYFCHALLQHYDRDNFEVFIYSNGAHTDDKTELFKSMVGPSNFFKIDGMPAKALAEKIWADRIHILIDLSGHTAHNRLDVMALKPAPVQFTWIGYNNTTGLGAIDYRVTDAVVDPLDTEQKFSEELVRLPDIFLCYTPPAKVPDVGPLPALRNQYVTFGSFSCLAKVNPHCVATWARVLNDVPGSRLLLKTKGFSSAEVCDSFVAQFRSHGVAGHRLTLLSLTPTSFDHLSVYNKVDIALDAFPYANTTTTCETMLMGVPVVTLAGNTHGHRVGKALVIAVGMQELVAYTADEFVSKATALAADLNALAERRRTLRERLLASPLCDGPTFLRKAVEPMFQEKWLAYVAGRPPSGGPAPGPAPALAPPSRAAPGGAQRGAYRQLAFRAPCGASRSREASPGAPPAATALATLAAATPLRSQSPQALHAQAPQALHAQAPQAQALMLTPQALTLARARLAPHASRPARSRALASPLQVMLPPSLATTPIGGVAAPHAMVRGPLGMHGVPCRIPTALHTAMGATTMPFVAPPRTLPLPLGFLRGTVPCNQAALAMRASSVGAVLART